MSPVTVVALELGVLIVALLAMAVVFWVMHQRLLNQLYDRQRVLDSVIKSAAKEPLRAITEAQRVLALTQAVRDDAQTVLRRVEQHLDDPRVRRMLGG